MLLNARWSAPALVASYLCLLTPQTAVAGDAPASASGPWPYREPMHLGWFDDQRPLDGSYRYDPTALWSGFYIGGTLGGALGSTGTGGSGIGDVSTGGFTGGILGGYNIQLGSVVAGIEADLAWANLDGDENAAGVEATAGHDWLASVRGRLGYASESWLVYATAGFAFTEVSLDVTDGATVAKDSARPAGFVYGAGAEYAISPQLSLRGEILRYNFEDMDFKIPGGAISAEPDVTTVRAGLSLRFN